MKKQEYIVGDVVEYDKKIMAIRELESINCVGLSFPKENRVHCYAPIWKLKPVPLSTIILKNNGWGITEVNCEDENQELHYETFSKCRIMADIRYYPNWSDDTESSSCLLAAKKSCTSSTSTNYNICCGQWEKIVQ